MMLNTMHVTRLRLLHTCPMACILSARPSPMPGPSVHTSNGQASSRHVHVWELSRRSCTRCARLHLARRRYPLRATTSRCRRSLAERCTVRVLTARDCVSPVADTRCAQLRLARRRCRAHACLSARLASLRHVHMWALPRILAERYHDTVRVQTRSRACDLADLSSSCANVPAGLLHLHALSSRSSDCMPRVFTRMRRVPAGLKTRRSRLRAARRRCPAAACMPVLLAS